MRVARQAPFAEVLRLTSAVRAGEPQFGLEQLPTGPRRALYHFKHPPAGIARAGIQSQVFKPSDVLQWRSARRLCAPPGAEGQACAHEPAPGRFAATTLIEIGVTRKPQDRFAKEAIEASPPRISQAQITEERRRQAVRHAFYALSIIRRPPSPRSHGSDPLVAEHWLRRWLRFPWRIEANPGHCWTIMPKALGRLTPRAFGYLLRQLLRAGSLASTWPPRRGPLAASPQPAKSQYPGNSSNRSRSSSTSRFFSASITPLTKRSGPAT